VNTIEKETMFTEGFRLISLLIYDTSHKQLLDFKDKLIGFGIKVYGCNNQCSLYRKLIKSR
jgi:hypothetical protein